MSSERYATARVPIRGWIAAFLAPRYLAQCIVLAVAFYAAVKFVLLVFQATDTAERWVFELTPFFLAGLLDLPLALLSAALLGADAYLHYHIEKNHRRLAMGLTGLAVVSLVLALGRSGSELDAVSGPRLGILFLLLATVPLDHIDILRRREAAGTEAEVPTAGFEGEAPLSEEALEARELIVHDLASVVEEPITEGRTVEKPAIRGRATAEVPPARDEAYLRELLRELSEGDPEGVGDLPRAEPSVADDRERPSAEGSGIDTDIVAAIDPLVELDEELVDRVEPARIQEVGRGRRGLFGKLSRSRAERLDESFAAAKADLAARRDARAARRIERIYKEDPTYPGISELAAIAYDFLGDSERADAWRRRAL